MPDRAENTEDLLLRELRAAVSDRRRSGADAEEVTDDLRRRLRRLAALGAARPCSGRSASPVPDSSEV